MIQLCSSSQRISITCDGGLITQLGWRLFAAVNPSMASAALFPYLGVQVNPQLGISSANAQISCKMASTSTIEDFDFMAWTKELN
ncbi:hypothetical protein PIB30_068838 [Stylosanthes scabra]|uniref:Uncharacterized protein n=1 Tax=Stylosanthes scabra TaxID=79078 RepID=A0ABU6XPC9_9FABA|nr:hypothetical protein [Stylosanthes scabra]